MMADTDDAGVQVMDAETPSPELDGGDAAQHLRMAEALLFAAVEPLDNKSIAARLPDDANVPAIMKELSRRYEGRGVTLFKVAGKWAFRTAPDLAFLLEKERTVVRRLSKAAVETLAIVAYHQPVTRAEIEEIRGVGISRGTLDMLMEVGWVRLRGRRRTPGRPVTYGTSEEFLDHFGLEGLDDLPGVEELKKSGLLRAEPPTSLFPVPNEDAELEDTEPDEIDADGEMADDGDPADGTSDDIVEPPHVIEAAEALAASAVHVNKAVAASGGPAAEAAPGLASTLRDGQPHELADAADTESD